MLSFIMKSALMMSPVGGFLKMIPARVWKLIGVAMVVLTLVWGHQHVAHKRIKQADAAGYLRGYRTATEDTKKAQAAAEAKANTINTTIRKKSDEEARHIVRSADDLRVRGPGKATCSGVAAPPGAAGRYEQAHRPADAAVDPVPDRERPALIAMPFTPTLEFAKQCDLNRNEALSWRESDEKQRDVKGPGQR